MMGVELSEAECLLAVKLSKTGMPEAVAQQWIRDMIAARLAPVEARLDAAEKRGDEWRVTASAALAEVERLAGVVAKVRELADYLGHEPTCRFPDDHCECRTIEVRNGFYAAMDRADPSW